MAPQQGQLWGLDRLLVLPTFPMAWVHTICFAQSHNLFHTTVTDAAACFCFKQLGYDMSLLSFGGVGFRVGALLPAVGVGPRAQGMGGLALSMVWGHIRMRQSNGPGKQLP